MFRFVYRVLLLAYPRRFRVDHGDEVSRVFADACRESWREHGLRGVLERLLRAFVDVPARGLAERTSARRPGGPRRRSALAQDVWQDVRYGVRSLHRSPAFALTAVLVMTIGIALNTAMFTAFNAVGLRPWPVENADRLLLVTSHSSTRQPAGGFSLDDLERFERSQTLSVVAGVRRAFMAVSLEPGGRGR